MRIKAAIILSLVDEGLRVFVEDERARRVKFGSGLCAEWLWFHAASISTSSNYICETLVATGGVK
jgi:hypothetical protein